MVSAIENTQGQGKAAAKGKKDTRPGKSAGRLRISLYQKLELENIFQRTPYPTRAVRAQLAHKLGLRYQTVVVSMAERPIFFTQYITQNISNVQLFIPGT